jgi:radical SAM superfamily enzyme YgiQ (UPF0313 family)
MVGNPNETIEDIEKTKKLAKEISPDFASVFWTTPFPGTELYDMAIKNNWVNSESILDFSNIGVGQSSIENPVMEINFSMDEIKKIRGEIQNMFVIRNYMSYLRNPKFVFKIMKVIGKRPKGFVNGLKKFSKSRNIDDIFLSLAWQYRESLYNPNKKGY